MIQVIAHGDIHSQLAASINFKNFIGKNWYSEYVDLTAGHTQRSLIPEDCRTFLKANLVPLMIQMNSKVRAQLVETIGIIAKHDFPGHWNELLPELVKVLQQGDMEKSQCALEILNSITQKYCILQQSDALWSEIKYVLQIATVPLLSVFHSAVETRAMDVVLLSLNIFYCLIAQDLPAEIEDTLAQWMPRMLLLLTLQDDQNSRLDAATVLDQIHASICQIATMFAERYEEEFKIFNGDFIKNVWNLLGKVSPSVRFDDVVVKAIEFISSVLKKQWNQSMFSNQEFLQQLCNVVVLPNIQLRDSDAELFEFNGVEYVNRDMEGSDQHTRRRAASDLIKVLTAPDVVFMQYVSELLSNYALQLVAKYQTDPAKLWLLKDTSMYLILALSIQGSTVRQGATRLNPLIDVMGFFSQHVLPELRDGDVNVNPILKADCIKFATVFRSHLPLDSFSIIIPVIAKYLGSDSFVVHSYAAIALDRILTLRDVDTRTLRFNSSSMRPYLGDMVTSIFRCFSHEESSENHYVMKCLLQVCVVSGEACIEVAQPLLGAISQTINRVADNPKNPMFNHYLFEVVVVLIDSLCSRNPQSIEKFEQVLFPVIEGILQKESSLVEFGPYAFQILAQLLYYRSEVSKVYVNLFPALLLPAYWEHSGNVHGLVELLRMYLSKPGFSEFVVSSKQIERLLGVFQKLVASMVNDVYALKLLSTIVQFFPWSVIGHYFPEVFKLLFIRAQRSMTPKFGKGFVTFMSFFVLIHGVDELVRTMDAVQPGIFAMVLTKIWPNYLTINDRKDRKIVILAMAKIVFDSPILRSEGCANILPTFAKLMTDLLLSDRGQAEHDSDRTMTLDEMQAGGFSNIFSKLTYAKKLQDDCFSNLNERKVVGEGFNSLRQRDPQMMMAVSSLVPNESINHIIEGI